MYFPKCKLGDKNYHSQVALCFPKSNQPDTYTTINILMTRNTVATSIPYFLCCLSLYKLKSLYIILQPFLLIVTSCENQYKILERIIKTIFEHYFIKKSLTSRDCPNLPLPRFVRVGIVFLYIGKINYIIQELITELPLSNSYFPQLLLLELSFGDLWVIPHQLLLLLFL